MIENIKKFGNISNDDFLFNSYIINNNEDYIKYLKDWINEEQNNTEIKSKLLYRLTDNGEEFSKFHELCDNQGSTLTLFQINDGNKVGIFTSLSWENSTNNLKEDEKIFIFNLNQNKKYKNIRKKYSIFCQSDHGAYTDYFGNDNKCKTMKKLFHGSKYIHNTYENGFNILQSDGKDKYYDLSEVEIFKIIIK